MRKHRVAGVCALVLLLVVLYAPLVRLVVNAFNANELATTWGGFTLRWFRAAVHNDGVRRSIRTSAVLAAFTSMVSVVLGTLLVLGLKYANRGTVFLGRLLAVARVTTPEVILATGLFVMLPIIGLHFGFTALLIGHVVYLTGFVIVLVGARAASADPLQEEAAADLGASPARVLLRVVLPNLYPAIGAAALLSAAFSFDDVALSRVLASPTTTTLPLILVSMIQRRVTPEIDAISTLLLIIGAALFVIALAAGRGIDTIRQSS